MLTKVVPIFVALMVWVIRILIIGTLSVAGERIFSSASRGINEKGYAGLPSRLPTATSARPAYTRPVSQTRSEISHNNQPEPTYHSLIAKARNTPPRPGGMNDPRR